jgi:hypothetical protein
VELVGTKRRPSGRTDKSFDINHAVAEMIQLLRMELQRQGCDDEAVGAAASRIVTANQKDGTTEPSVGLKEERALLRDRLFRTFVACGLPVRDIATIMNRDSRGASEAEFNAIIRRTRVRLGIIEG